MLHDWYFSYKPDTLTSVILLFLFISYLAIEIKLTIKNKAFQMNAEPLTKQYLFKQSIRVPCCSALFFGVLSWFGHLPKFDSEGFTNFILISKLPIGMLSLTIPFVAVVNNIHRTIQTNAQIEAAQKKNLSDSYYSHFKHITDYFTNLPKRSLGITATNNNDINYEYYITYPVHLYNFIFKDNSPNTGICNSQKEYTKKLSDTFFELASECNKLTAAHINRGEYDTPFDTIREQAIALFKVECKLDILHKMLCIKTPELSYHYGYFTNSPGVSLVTSFGSSFELSGRLEIISQFMLNVMEITTSISFQDILMDDKGTFYDSIEYLKKNKPLIFKLIKYQLGQHKPSLIINGDTVAART